MKSYLYMGLVFLVLTACTGRPNIPDIAATGYYPDVERKLSGCPDGGYPCGQETPFSQLIEKTTDQPDRGRRHYVSLLEHGDDALVARLHLIRSAKQSIDFQTFIWGADDVSDLFFRELVLAARRGVHVRIIVDQLTGNRRGKWLTYGAFVHENLQIKLYNPTFYKGKNSSLDLMAAFLFYYRTFNQRMHNKVLIIDSSIGIIGGRNIERKYFDLDPDFIFKDRDVLVIGPVISEMERSFSEYWYDKRSVPLTWINDKIFQHFDNSSKWLPMNVPLDPMLSVLYRRASDTRYIEEVFVDSAIPVSGKVQFFADYPGKKLRHDKQQPVSCTAGLNQIVFSADHSLVMQTPYLLFSRKALRRFKRLTKKKPSLQIIASTNSLAATDCLPAYAVAFKQKKRLVKKLKFQIYELKPVPGDIHRMVRNYGQLESFSSHVENQPDEEVSELVARLQVGIHGKSFVIDNAVAWVGSHNFDPRSDYYNTEVALAIWDRAVAVQLKDYILRDAAPQNSYFIAKQPQVPIISYFSGLLGNLSRALPFFDLWPFRYTTSYELRAGKTPVSRDHPQFYEHYQNMGAFPGINLSMRAMQARLLTAMGGFLAPIL